MRRCHDANSEKKKKRRKEEERGKRRKKKSRRRKRRRRKKKKKKKILVLVSGGKSVKPDGSLLLSLSTARFKIVFMHLGKPMCAPASQIDACPGLTF